MIFSIKQSKLLVLFELQFVFHCNHPSRISEVKSIYKIIIILFIILHHSTLFFREFLLSIIFKIILENNEYFDYCG